MNDWIEMTLYAAVMSLALARSIKEWLCMFIGGMLLLVAACLIALHFFLAQALPVTGRSYQSEWHAIFNKDIGK